jgi:hypothetical protein
MSSVRFFFKRFMLWLTGNCFPKQVPLPPPAHSVLGSVEWFWEWQRTYPLWATTREGVHMLGRAGPSRGHKGVSLARAPMGMDQRVSGKLQYIPESDLSSRHTWRCVAPLTSPVAVHTLHAQCPTHQTLLFTWFLQFPRAFNIAWMCKIALFFNNT